MRRHFTEKNQKEIRIGLWVKLWKGQGSSEDLARAGREERIAVDVSRESGGGARNWKGKGLGTERGKGSEAEREGFLGERIGGNTELHSTTPE